MMKRLRDDEKVTRCGLRVAEKLQVTSYMMMKSYGLRNIGCKRVAGYTIQVEKNNS